MIRFITIMILLFCEMVFSQSDEVLSSRDYLQKIRVTLGGDFKHSGTYTAIKGEKLDQFITRILNSFKSVKTNSALSAEVESDLQSMKLIRGLKLIRNGNPNPIDVDLYKFRQSGNQELNPYLENDDIILFPSIDLQTSIIDISGAVNKPGGYLFIKGDSLKDILNFAGGFNSIYDNTPIVEVSRLTSDGESEQFLKLTLDSDFNLKPGDRIRVNAGENNRKAFRVYVSGEVNNPGEIYITKSKTRLVDVIKKAGGFKTGADLTKAELLRGSISSDFAGNTKVLDQMMMRRMSAINDEDSIIFAIDNMIRLERGNGVVDFTKLVDSTSFEASFLVKDGDWINIPDKQELVYVFGQINNPGYTKYTKGAGIDFYIKNCGGIGETANDEIYLIKAKSRSWFLLSEQSSVEIEPGDFIWVSKKPVRNFDYYLQKVGSIASIVGGITTTIMLLISL